MLTRRVGGLLVLLGQLSCSSPMNGTATGQEARPRVPPIATSGIARQPETAVKRATVPPRPASQTAGPAEVKSIDPDGNDEPIPEGEGLPPGSGHFERVGKAPLSLRQVCSLVPLGDALYAAHSLAALGADGATITRYRKSDDKRPFAIAFDWNRPGQPTKGGGAGQGFLRVRHIGDRLFVADADPPYNGFGLLDWGTEGYVFVSNTEGRFAPAIRPNFRPPGRPSPEGKAGAMVVPRAYHVFDVIRYRGKLITSTGAVPPKEKAWVGPSPGALHVATPDLSRFDYSVSYPNPYAGGVYRLTFLVRFKDTLFAGIQDYDGRAEHDLVRVRPPADAESIEQRHLSALRVTEGGGAQTLRFYTHRGTLYWIAWGHDGVRLRTSSDGENFTPIDLPAAAGAPLDIVGFRGTLYLLCEWGLYRFENRRTVEVARVIAPKTPFMLRDSLCAAPLTVYDNELYAGGQLDGSLYRFVESDPSGAPSQSKQ